MIAIDSRFLERKDLSIYEKMMMVAIARTSIKHFCGDSISGIKVLAELASVSERKARSTVKSLEEKGLIHVTRQPGQTNVYLISKNL